MSSADWSKQASRDNVLIGLISLVTRVQLHPSSSFSCQITCEFAQRCQLTGVTDDAPQVGARALLATLCSSAMTSRQSARDQLLEEFGREIRPWQSLSIKGGSLGLFPWLAQSRGCHVMTASWAHLPIAVPSALRSTSLHPPPCRTSSPCNPCCTHRPCRPTRSCLKA